MSESSAPDYNALLKRSYVQIKELQARLKASSEQSVSNEPVAIIGMACRFPGGVTTPDALWQLLRSGGDGVVDIPSERWDSAAYYDPAPETPGKMYVSKAGFLDEVDRFDATFFGISPREAESMDPQQRLLLEVAWEALERAGQSAEKLTGSATGVFIGISSSDYSHFSWANREDLNAYVGTGSAYSVAAGRLAYVLGLQGPTFALDTACSSSLVALHLASQSLRSKECRMALVGGVNAILRPDGMIYFCKLHALSPDGHCKSFDAAADGYARGEGCGVLVLKRLSDALADGDSILAVVRGSAINHDGRSSGLTAPNGKAQQALIRQALSTAGVEAGQIDYVEAHGTGTPLGDPIEANALQAEMGKGRSPEHPLYLGSVKANLGHLEAAAGVAALMKVILSLKNEAIPPQIHFQRLNPHIHFDACPVKIPVRLTPWPQGDRKRLAGISSFGFSGTNAHVILEEAPAPRPLSQKVGGTRDGLLTLSAHNQPALRTLASRYAEFLQTHPEASLSDLCATAHIGRSHFTHRLALMADSTATLSRDLAAFAAGQTTQNIHTAVADENRPPQVAFLFTGQGSQYAGMGHELYDTQPAFRRAFDRAAAALNPHLPRPLLDVIFAAPDSPESQLLDQTAFTQPALFALQFALAETWRAWGVQPTAVIGHSVGEFAAACIAGVLSLEDAAKLIAARGRLMGALPTGGAMAAIFADEATVAKSIASYANTISLAAINAPNEIVISGLATDLESVLTRIEAQGIRTYRLRVSHAFHSPLMEPMLDEFAALAAGVSYSLPEVGLISNVSGKLLEAVDAAYWRQHVRAPVRFAGGVQTLHELGCDILLEIGPQPVLLGLAQRQWPESPDHPAAWLPSLRAGRSDWMQMLDSLAQLYVRGGQIDWQGYEKDDAHRRLSLPTYPFERKRHWLDNSRTATVPSPLQGHAHPLLGQRMPMPLSSEIRFLHTLNSTTPAHLRDHQVGGRILAPAASFLSLALQAAAALWGAGALMVENCLILQPLILAENEARPLQTILTPSADGAMTFQIVSCPQNAPAEWVLHATGKVSRAASALKPAPFTPAEMTRRDAGSQSARIYENLAAHGYHYGPAFTWLNTLWPAEDELIAQLERPTLPDQPDDYALYPPLLDACLQALATLGDTQEERIYLPFSFGRVIVHEPLRADTLNGALWVRARRSPVTESDTQAGDITLYDAEGRAILLIEQFTARAINPAAFQARPKPALDDFYQLEWQPSPIPGADTVSGRWLLVAGSNNPLATVLTNALTAQGQQVVQIAPHSDFLGELALPGPSWRGIIHLTHLEPFDQANSDSALPDALLSVLPAIQTLIGAAQPAPRLWVVTQGAQPLGNTPDPWQAPAWGLGRTIAIEHPELWGGLVDVDPAASPLENARHLTELLLSSSTQDNQFASRSGQWHVARLVALRPAHQTFTLQPDASYLISGGMGALGLAVASWLVDQGASDLILLGRSAPSENAQAEIARMQQAGAKVLTFAVDVADRAALQAVLAQVGPVRGVIHAAGVLDDAALLNQDRPHFERVFAPKVAGAWNLHQLTQQLPLDFFVLFSSVTAMIGAPGQANYAAANAFLDALAHLRQANGQPALSINWGPWAEIGMAARSQSAGKQRALPGWTSLFTHAGLEAFRAALTLTAPQVGIFPVDWSSFLQQFPAEGRPAWAAALVAPSAAVENLIATPLSIPGSLLPRLREARPEERLRLLTNAVSMEISSVLHLESNESIQPQRRLFDVGLDSLMAVELKNRLQALVGQSLPATLVFNYSSLDALITYFAQLLQLSETDAPEPSATADARAGMLDEIEQISDEEAEDLLNQELAALLKKGKSA